MAISFIEAVQADSGGAAVTSQDITVPTSATAGRVLVLAVLTDSRVDTFGVEDSGGESVSVTEIINVNPQPGASGKAQVQVWYRVVQVGDAGETFTVTISHGRFVVLGLMIFDGVDTSNPVDVSGGASDAEPTGNTLTAPSVSATVAGMLLTIGACRTFNENQSATPPPGMTEAFDGFSSTRGGSGNYQQLGGAGATGTRTITISENVSAEAAVNIVLMPVSIPASGGQGMTYRGGRMSDIISPVDAHKSVTLGAGVTTDSVPLGANGVLLQALTQNVRVTVDGTTPTASSGFRLTAGNDVIALPVGSGTTLKFLREADGAILQYQFVSRRTL